ncbi:hypothetical protein N7E81_04140 [Reichenbachiella carrageenanivorans]|uniref:Lipoprotein n=1 Tax=Reichenbachiella carrageenanivorans TaxID=2979869 RepID=A0ABY6D314_9BACT|nr:hypothetical protein [Reichenbachiella carrageenanivorans]UXX80289.1 hypothetical protein N7E81_04140 [Reichenbachiella carrageenanivorans]
MKKLSYIFLCVSLLATGCSTPEDSVFETVVGTATIEGKLTFNKDQTGTDVVPASGAKVTITYSSEDVSYGNPNGVDVTKTVEVTTNDQGRFTAEVPAIAKTATYTIKPQDFLTEYQVSDGGTGLETKTGYYEKDEETVDTFEGETTYVSYEYTFVSEF